MEQISIPALCYRVYVVVADDFEKAAKGLWLEYEGELGSESALTLTPLLNVGESYIFLRQKKDLSSIMDEIAHESWHAVNQMFDFVGAELENEMVAYHLGYIARSAYDIWRNK